MPSDVPTRAAALFAEITAIPAGRRFKFFEDRLGDPVAGEGEYVDYKGGENLSPRSADVAKNWSKALSGFANGDGGVLVWGIAAPNNTPTSLSHFPDVHDLCRRLKELQGGATEPTVQDVEIVPIEDPRQPPRGIVVCHIPSSKWRPHKALAAGTREHYMRTGDNFVPIPHAVLKLMFYPQHPANLAVVGRVERYGGSSKLALKTWIRNDGPASAYDVFVNFRLPQGISLESTTLKGWEWCPSGLPGVSYRLSRPLHPTETVPFWNAAVIGEISDSDFGVLSFNPSLFHFRLFAKDQEPLWQTIKLETESLVLAKLFTAGASGVTPGG